MQNHRSPHEYLESLYADAEEDQSEPEQPLLLSSKLLSSALARPSFAEKSQDHRLFTLNSHPSKNEVKVEEAGSGFRRNSAGPLTSSSRHLSPLHGTSDPQQLLDDVMERIDRCTIEYEQCMMETSQAQELVKKVQAEIENLRAEERELLDCKPPAADRLHKVQHWLEVRHMTLQVQQELAETKQFELLSVEASLRQAETELDRLADSKQELGATQNLDSSLRSKAASRLQDWEVRSARMILQRLEDKVALIEDVTAKHEEDRSRVLDAAEEGRTAAKERLKVGMEKIKRNQQRGEAALAQTNETRRQAVMNLKSNLTAVKQDVAQKAGVYRMLQKQKKEVQEREFQDLLDQGLNPYEVYRKREVDTQLARQQKDILDNISSRQAIIASQLALEEEAHAREVADKEVRKREAEKLQKELGIAAAEQRTEEYMLRSTKAHVSMLDTTGHYVIEPSKATMFKTKDFGLGRADPALLEEMQRIHPNVGPKDLLMPSRYRDDARSLLRGSSSRKSRALDDIEGALDLNSDDDDDSEDSPPGTPKSRADEKDGNRKGNHGHWKVLETKPLTKFEVLAMDKAKSRHRENIGRSKIMMGRQFTGDAFMPTPSLVIFKDFDINSTYKQKVTITNRSYEKNTYKVVQVPPEYGDVLQVTYDLPGYIATGVSGEITITFTPKQNEDIETQIEMLADTGPFSIPIRCLTKKADLKLSCSLVDFGPGVTLGESTQKTFTITNSGALALDFSLSSAAGDKDAGEGRLVTAPSLSRSQMMGGGKRLHIGDFIAQPSTGSVPGYGSATITIQFAPSQSGPSSEPLSVIFKALAQGRRPPSVPPASLQLIGKGQDVPVFLEESVIDFKCAMVDHTYRVYLQIRNGGKTAMKVSVVNRHDIAEFFSFSPDFGFCQGGEAFPIKIQFCPKASMTTLCAKYLVDAERGVFEIPMKLHVPDQQLPVTFLLRAQVTSSDLIFEPPSLDFGSCIMNENTALVLRITNPSTLPQTFGFQGPMPGVTISPNDGFGHILPGETLERIVSFQPSIPGPQSLVITARTLAGRSFSLPLTSIGVQPNISVSHNRIRFPATSLNDVSMVSLMLRNNTDHPQAFEFGLPLDAGELCFCPHVGEIPPQSNFRVQVEFSPRPSPSSLDTLDSTEAPSSIRDMDEEDEAQPSDSSKWYRWKQIAATCFIRPNSHSRPFSAQSRPASHASIREGSSGESRGNDLGTSLSSMSLEGYAGTRGGMQQLSLNIETCAVLPDIALKTPLPEIPDKGMFELDFGPVPVGQLVTRVIEICNQGQDIVPIKVDPLQAAEVFGHVNALRPLSPGGTFRSLLSFCPQERMKYMEVLTFHGVRMSVKVALKGLGIAPELKVEPKEVLGPEGVDMGDVFVGEQAEKKIVVTNVCPFPLAFSMLFRGVPDPNPQMKPPFFARPSEGELAQGESAEITLVFQPSNSRPYFRDLLTIHVPNQQEMLTVPLTGRCWSEGLFIAGPEYPIPNEDPFMEDKFIQLVADRAAQEVMASSQGLAAGGKPTTPPSKAGAAAGKKSAPAGSTSLTSTSSKPQQLVLEFPDPLYLNEIAMVTFEVGSLKSQLGGAPGELIFYDISPAMKGTGWSIVEGTKIALAAGERKKVTVKYSSPAQVSSNMAAFFGHNEFMELNLGSVLKGGLPAPGPEGTRQVNIRFRALLKPTSRPEGGILPASILNASSVEAASAGATKKK